MMDNSTCADLFEDIDFDEDIPFNIEEESCESLKERSFVDYNVDLNVGKYAN